MSGIVEIAERAGVSAATVSRALRGLHHVNERTRKKIVEAAQELDYPIRPDLLPRSESSRTNTIGVIAPFLSRWYFSQSVAGVEQALREAGMDLLLYNFAQVDARQRIFQQKKLVDKVDGLIVISLPPSDKEFQEILGLGIPVFLQVATRSIVERKSLLNKDFSLLSIYRRLINILVDQIDNYCIKNVDSIFVENNWMFNYCSKMQLDGAPQIHLAYPGINTYKFKPLENRMLFIDKDFYILSVGRFSDPRKNIIFLLECYIKIFNKFSTPPKLVLAGASSPDSKFWDLVLENNLQEFVEFRSNPSEEELIAIYQGACCFALTSNEEGFGMVLIEAMSCGIPVVSTKCGGPDSIISDSSDGFLVDIGDHEKFSESLFHLCIHKGANLNMGHIARSNALRRYSHDSTKELFLNEYKKFLST